MPPFVPAVITVRKANTPGVPWDARDVVAQLNPNGALYVNRTLLDRACALAPNDYPTAMNSSFAMVNHMLRAALDGNMAAEPASSEVAGPASAYTGWFLEVVDGTDVPRTEVYSGDNPGAPAWLVEARAACNPLEDPAGFVKIMLEIAEREGVSL